MIKKTLTASLLAVCASVSFAGSSHFLFHLNSEQSKVKVKKTMALASAQSSRQQSDPGFYCWDPSDPDDWRSHGGVCFGYSRTTKAVFHVTASCNDPDVNLPPLVCDGKPHDIFPEDGDQDFYPNEFYSDGMLIMTMYVDQPEGLPLKKPLVINYAITVNGCTKKFSGTVNPDGTSVQSSDVAGKAFNCIGGNAAAFTEIPQQ